MRKDSQVAVEIPAAERDKPAWVKVGVIAAVGFIVGVAWPRIAGVRMGPSAPGEAASASASAHPRAPEAAPSGSSTSAALRAPAPSVSAAPSASAQVAAVGTVSTHPPTVAVQKGLVVSCKTEGGETRRGGKECGAVPGVDALVLPRLRKLAGCAGMEGQTGKLSFTANADFASGRFWYDVGKNSTLPNLDAATACLKTAFHGTSTTATPHEHSRYTVVYTATFTSAAGAPDGDERGHKPDSTKAKEPAPGEEKAAGESAVAKEGEAQVTWEVALVRESPKTGNLLSRLPRGTKVKVGASRDGWYAIKFGDNFGSDGWVYRGAIGR